MKLFSMFSSTSEVEVISQPKVSLIQEIHNSFNNNIDKLLIECGIMKSTYDINRSLKDKVYQLNSLGFNESQEVKNLENLIKKNQAIESENSRKKEILDDINYFKEKYPLYKIIDWESIEFLCNKYKLMYGSVKFYKGIIPEKNLKEMLNFKIDDEDKLFIISDRSDLYDYAKLDLQVRENKPSEERYRDGRNYYGNFYKAKPSLIICAPSKDFNLEFFSQENKNKYGQLKAIVKEDPIVIQPVFRGSNYSKRKYGIIETAWGDEASDSLVVNEKMN